MITARTSRIPTVAPTRAPVGTSVTSTPSRPPIVAAGTAIRASGRDSARAAAASVPSITAGASRRVPAPAPRSASTRPDRQPSTRKRRRKSVVATVAPPITIVSPGRIANAAMSEATSPARTTDVAIVGRPRRIRAAPVTAIEINRNGMRLIVPRPRSSPPAGAANRVARRAGAGCGRALPPRGRSRRARRTGPRTRERRRHHRAPRRGSR